MEGTLGWVLYRKGLYDNAVRLLEDASQKDAAAKTDGATLRKYHLGMAYLKTGNRPQALKLLATAIGANRDLPEAEAVQQLLARNGAR